ncbi:uncharacterized protein J7T54_006053 [Emericellopsis cladophorae]|uniref:Glycoprotease family protein n=1 Tax=Emericellopsis cladophorae TaxID=2686198 RepID=A0A9P9YA36_9HYPO|nr:uncharacterized protein J7T54_006053 [Emericellopsis cladophorae]KAI6785714.1 hypothetical protein J7T54_006053 [Emericellopsis cladophorae]
MATTHIQPQQLGGATRRQSTDDWENWEDEDVVTPIDPSEQVAVEVAPPNSYSSTQQKPHGPRQSLPRLPTTRVRRLKSKHRQRAQNAMAGIKVITDMTTFRGLDQAHPHNGKPAKFVDAAALRALEGEPNSASVGNWNWLKKNKGKSPASATPQTATPKSGGVNLTPGDAPIMIGISFPSSDENTGGDNAPRVPSASPVQGPAHAPRAPSGPQISVWSPDTPETASTTNGFRPASSVYSQATSLSGSKQPINEDVPPVPALPSGYKTSAHRRLISLEGGHNSDDGGSPCTLFEEDGSPKTPRSALQQRMKAAGLTPDSAGSRANGWWDHVVTPFLDKRFTFQSRKTRLDSPIMAGEAQTHNSPSHDFTVDEKAPQAVALPVPRASPPPIVRAPTPRRTPTPPTSGHRRSAQPTPPTSLASNNPFLSEKTHVTLTPNLGLGTPPPYSPPRQPHEQSSGVPIRYRAVFPPGHPLQAQFPPSPVPGSPGLAATMTSQGATQMTNIPITPTFPPDMPAPLRVPLPDRALATTLLQEHSHDARGDERKVERERRRHEKEDIMARKLGGFWRGRGCIPATGCFGRTGREGRKRRRWCLVITALLLLLIILATVLGVVLTQPKGSHEVESIWRNLTDFPPMPTGVMTVVGSDNIVAKSGCTEPSTLWSCSLPKEQHESVAPYRANQPTFIMQIQWDNSTREQWNVPNGEPPKSVARRSKGMAASARAFVRDGQATEFKPNPEPPAFEDMWFLGDTTDEIESDEKAGEPAPFFISLLDSVDDEVENPVLDKRQTRIGDDLVKDLISAADLGEDGTPQPARMLPSPGQQPVRLYDRGLPTEHYGFYTYFKRTIYLKSLNNTDNDVPLDIDGGCTQSEANYYATWSQTRMLVQIWTRTLEDGSQLLPEGDSIEGTPELVRPGTMPYPVTVTLDTHGGNPKEKFVWYWPVDERGQLDQDNPKLLPNDLEFAGTVVNHRKDTNDSFGGYDGGTGGCRCEWVNWT